MQVTSGSIELDFMANGNSPFMAIGDGFTLTGNSIGPVGCPEPPATPCGGVIALIGSGTFNLTQPVAVDSLFNILGETPFTPDGSPVITYTQSVTYNGSLFICASITCPAEFPDPNYSLILTGDTGTMTATIVKLEDGKYDFSKVVYTINGPTASTPEPTTGFLLCFALPVAGWLVKRRRAMDTSQV
jgi:hypothetical protein